MVSIVEVLFISRVILIGNDGTVGRTVSCVLIRASTQARPGITEGPTMRWTEVGNTDYSGNKKTAIRLSAKEESLLYFC